MAFATFLTLTLFCAGSALALLLSDNQWAKDHASLIPVSWTLTTTFAAFALASARWFRKLFVSQERVNQGAIRQEIRDSPVGGDVRIAGRDYNETHIHDWIERSVNKLTLLFDPTDPQCIRLDNKIPREYRVKVVNETGMPMHNIHVKIEGTLPELQHHVGVRLRVIHGTEYEATANLANGAREYFNLMEYNPLDQAIDRPVIHICHTSPNTVPVNVPVHNYRFRLQAYSDESMSDPVSLHFEQLFNSQSHLLVS
jgi:hypothetical protein